MVTPAPLSHHCHGHCVLFTSLPRCWTTGMLSLLPRPHCAALRTPVLLSFGDSLGRVRERRVWILGAGMPRAMRGRVRHGRRHLSPAAQPKCQPLKEKEQHPTVRPS